MSNEFWIMLILHVIVFFITRRILSKKKRSLELDKAHLLVENQKQKGEIEYFKRKLAENK